MVKFGYTILYVTDVKKTVEFYELAFNFKRKFITPENDYAELLSGTTTLSFASIKLANSNLKNGFIESNLRNKPFAIELGFITDDLDNILKQAVTYGAKIIEMPYQKPWGQTVAYLRDLDGFLIELCTPIS